MQNAHSHNHTRSPSLTHTLASYHADGRDTRGSSCPRGPVSGTPPQDASLSPRMPSILHSSHLLSVLGCSIPLKTKLSFSFPSLKRDICCPKTICWSPHFIPRVPCCPKKGSSLPLDSVSERVVFKPPCGQELARSFLSIFTNVWTSLCSPFLSPLGPLCPHVPLVLSACLRTPPVSR